MAAGATLMAVLGFALAIAVSVLVLIFVLVPILKGLGWLIAGLVRGIGWVLLNTFKGIGWFVTHIFEYVAGTISDVIRFVGAVLALIILSPIALLNLVIGRWSAAGHFADSVKRECKVGAVCLYRMALQRPLKLVLLHGMLEGIEERVPEAMAGAPTVDTPRKRVGQFDGYTIVGSLRGGGSGAKLYVAVPDSDVQRRYPGMPDRVVIKVFALSEGSSLPQIVRESRALESAKQLGLVFEHGMDERRFYYVMPYHPGDHLGVVTRQLHGEAPADGLGTKQLVTVIGHVRDLVATLETYHAGGLWHKDVKPENIIIDSGRARLVDLGLVTPLRSAMTLTTHGTEYFRDPELVRQALRGVKVHQIDGAKFDVYAAGAVLYFVIENTFPAHGALSRFSRKSPDALKWIVRRAMADYSHRYGTASEMLADIDYIAAASDPAAVKPADLPSMRGPGAVAFEPVEAEPAAVAHAGSPMPPRRDDAPVGSAGERVAASSARGPVWTSPQTEPRPQLEVTNWWTGEYRVREASGANPPAAAEPMVAAVGPGLAASEAAAYRHEVADLRHKVRTGAISARKAAREQVRSARARAKEMRKRLKSNRHDRRRGAVAERQPSLTLGIIGLVAIIAAGVVTASLITMDARRDRSRHVAHAASAPSVVESRGRPLLLVASPHELGESRAAQQIERIVKQYHADGYDVIVDDAIVDRDAFVELIETWENTRGRDGAAYREVDAALEEALARNSLYGLIHVTPNRKNQLKGSMVWSSRRGASERRFRHIEPAPDGVFLLVNDHPTKYVPEVVTAVDDAVDRYRSNDWQIAVDDELEATIRKALPPGRLDHEVEVPEALHAALARSDLGGIVYVSAAPGDGPASDRIDVRVIRKQ